MDKSLQEEFDRQLGGILLDYRKLAGTTKYDDFSDASISHITSLLGRAISAIERIAGEASTFSRQVDDVNSRYERDCHRLEPTMGLVMALKTELEKGFLQSVEQLVHSQLFSNYLEMSEYLVETGYKDAGAVLAGSSLEIHLRLLCEKSGISASAEKNNRSLRKKADRLNSELSKAEVYSKLDQKNVTAWLGLRNAAAHGEYESYTSEQVSLMISGVRDFLIRYPA